MNTQKTILSKEKLESLVEILGHKLTEKCHEYGGGIVFVCVMKGGFKFFSDLVKNINYPIKVEFVKCKSYDGQEQKEVMLNMDTTGNIKDYTVFIVDDILDSGNTMKALIKYFKEEKEVKNIETVSAVYKENVDFPKHFYIYKQPKGENPWYIGYGMDGPKGYSRNLSTINTL